MTIMTLPYYSSISLYFPLFFLALVVDLCSVRVTGRLSARVRLMPEGLAWASLQLLTPAFRSVCCIFAVIHSVAHSSLQSGLLALYWSSSDSQYKKRCKGRRDDRTGAEVLGNKQIQTNGAGVDEREQNTNE